MAEAKGKGDKEPERQKTVFVITPIGGANTPEREHADFVLHGAIEPVFKAKGYKVLRADTMADPAMINDGIFNAIFESDICVADLTFTNANVFYELGVRHTLLKPVIHIADEETRLPFDTAQHRAIMFRRSNWASFEALKAGLLAQLEAIEEEGFKVSNPITHARGRIEVAKSGDDRDQLISDLMARMDQMEQATRGLRSLNRHLRTGAFSGFEGEITRPKKVIEQIAEYSFADPTIEDFARFIRREYGEYITGLTDRERFEFKRSLEAAIQKHYMMVAEPVIDDIASN